MRHSLPFLQHMLLNCKLIITSTECAMMNCSILEQVARTQLQKKKTDPSTCYSFSLPRRAWFWLICRFQLRENCIPLRRCRTHSADHLNLWWNHLWTEANPYHRSNTGSTGKSIFFATSPPAPPNRLFRRSKHTRRASGRGDAAQKDPTTKE
jgi:hypothetical protein